MRDLRHLSTVSVPAPVITYIYIDIAIEKRSMNAETDKRLMKGDGDEEDEPEVLEIEADALPKSMRALLQLHLNIATVRFVRPDVARTHTTHMYELNRDNTI